MNVNWQAITDFQEQHPVKVVEAQTFLEDWRKNRQHARTEMLSFMSSCCALEASLLTSQGRPLTNSITEHKGLKPWDKKPEPSSLKGPLLVIFSGTLTWRLCAHLHQLMPLLGEHYLAMQIGGCAIGEGPYQSYANVASGEHQPLRMDVYVPGCPPTLEAIQHGFTLLEQKMDFMLGTNKSKAVLS